MINCIKRSRKIQQDKRSQFSIIHVAYYIIMYVEKSWLAQLNEIVYMQNVDHLASALNTYGHGYDLLTFSNIFDHKFRL